MGVSSKVIDKYSVYSIETAKDIQANTYYYGAIISSDVDFDEDYYRFEITEERNVSLELWHEKVTDSSVTWVASIIDENGNLSYVQSEFDSEQNKIKINEPRIYFGLETNDIIATNVINKQEFMEKLQNTIEEKCNELNIETINAYPYVSNMLYKKEQ